MKNLSILIPVHTAHLSMFLELLKHLEKQINDLCVQGEVEILFEIDSGEITTGAKRNLLLEQAKGDFIVTIDADDWVADCYVEEMLKAVSTGCDCVAINGTYTKDGKDEIQWFLSKDNINTTISVGGKNVFMRTTNHITAVRRELALKAKFTDKSFGEDSDYSNALKPYLKTEAVINSPLYFYRYVSTGKLY